MVSKSIHRENGRLNEKGNRESSRNVKVKHKNGKLLLLAIVAVVACSLVVTLPSGTDTQDVEAATPSSLLYEVYDEEGVSAKVTGFAGSPEANLVIPDNVPDTEDPAIAGLPVVAIADSAFRELSIIETADLGSVQLIGISAFYGCTGLETVDMATAEEIQYSAFYGCTELRKVTLLGSAAIDNQAFSGCSVTEIILKGDTFTPIYSGSPIWATDVPFKLILDGAVTEIPDYTFRYHNNLEEIVLPSTVKKIGDFAFTYCQSLVTINLGEVETIGKNAFHMSRNLATADLAEAITIGDYAFASAKLETVNAPKAKTIGESAFDTIRTITTLDIRSAESIGYRAFYNVEELEALTMPVAQPVMGEYTFFSVNALKVTFIGTGELAYDKSSFVNLYMPWMRSSPYELFVEGASSIGGDTFAGSKLTSMTLSPSVTEVKDGTFTDCSELTSVITTGGGLVKLGNSSFHGCTKLDSISFVKTEKIGDLALAQSALTSAVLSSVEDLGTEVFRGCIALTSVTLPSTMKSIEEGAFKELAALETINLDGVESIGKEAFINCLKLKDINISNAAMIDESAFSGCKALTKVDVSKATTIGDSAFFDCTALEEVILNPLMTKIANETFYGCSELTTIDLKNVTIIGDFAFLDCTALKKIDLHEVKDIDADDFVYGVGYQAFSGCIALEELTLPLSLNYRSSSFSKCVNIKTVNIIGIGDAGNFAPVLTSTEQKVSMIFSEGVTSVGTGLGKVSYITLPSTIKTIEKGAFSYNRTLETINLENVETIYSTAFMGCTGLTEVTMGSSVEIGADAFNGCTGLTEVTMGSSVEIGADAFNGCTGLTKVTLGSSVEIGADAFNGCTELSDIDLSEVTRIGVRAFSECEKLKSVDLSSLADVPGTPYIRGLGGSAFRNCTELTEVKVPITVNTTESFVGCIAISDITLTPGVDGIGYRYDWTPSTPWNIPKAETVNVTIEDGVEHIGDNTFFGGQMKSIIIPDSVKTIGQNAFRNCGSLKDVTLPISVRFDDSAFDGTATERITLTGTDGADHSTEVREGSGDPSYMQSPWYNRYVEITIEDTVKSIGNNTFSKSRITSIVIPDSVVSIGDSAFADCSSLTSLSVPISAKFGNGAFQNCQDLNEVILTGITGADHTATSEGTTVEWFKNTPWATNSQLMTVIISASVESVGAYTFADLRSEVTIRTSVGSSTLTVEDNAFNGTAGIIALPKGTDMNDTSYTGKVVYYEGTTLEGAQAKIGTLNDEGEGTVTLQFFTVEGKTPSSITVKDYVGVELSVTNELGMWKFTSVGDEMSAVAADTYLSTYTVTVEQPEGGELFYSIEDSTTKTKVTGTTIEVEIGFEIRIYAISDDYYEFRNWAGDGGEAKTGYLLVNEDNKGTGIGAVFGLIEYSISFDGTQEGLSVVTTGSVTTGTYGTAIEFEVTGSNGRDVYVTVEIGASSKVYAATDGKYTIVGNDVIGDVTIKAVNMYVFTIPENGSVKYRDITVNGTEMTTGDDFKIPFEHDVSIVSNAPEDYMMLDLNGNFDDSFTVNSVFEDVELEFIKYKETKTVDGVNTLYELTDPETAVLSYTEFNGPVLEVPATVTIGGVEYGVSGITTNPGGVKLIVLSGEQTSSSPIRTLTYDGTDMTASVDDDGNVIVTFDDPPAGKEFKPAATDSAGETIPMTKGEGNVWSFPLASGEKAKLNAGLSDIPSDGGGTGIIIAVAAIAIAAVAGIVVYFMFIRKP